MRWKASKTLNCFCLCNCFRVQYLEESMLFSCPVFGTENNASSHSFCCLCFEKTSCFNGVTVTLRGLYFGPCQGNTAGGSAAPGRWPCRLSRTSLRQRRPLNYRHFTHTCLISRRTTHCLGARKTLHGWAWEWNSRSRLIYIYSLHINKFYFQNHNSGYACELKQQGKCTHLEMGSFDCRFSSSRFYVRTQVGPKM